MTLLLTGAFTVQAATFNVLNTNDSGTNSLRQAILDANGTAGCRHDRLQYSGVGSELQHDHRRLHDHARVRFAAGRRSGDNRRLYTAGRDANTLASGNNAALRIELKGSSAAASGLVLAGTNGGSTVRGLVINRFTNRDFYDAGIFISSGNNVVEGNFIGTDASGASALPNACGIRVATGA